MPFNAIYIDGPLYVSIRFISLLNTRQITLKIITKNVIWNTWENTSYNIHTV